MFNAFDEGRVKTLKAPSQSSKDKSNSGDVTRRKVLFIVKYAPHYHTNR